MALSLRTRIALVTLECVGLLAFGGFGVVGVVAARSGPAVLDSLRRVGLGAADDLCAVADLYLASEDEETIAETLERTMGIAALAYVRVLDASGRTLLERRGPFERTMGGERWEVPAEVMPLGAHDSPRVVDDGGVFHVARAVTLEGQRLGTVVVGVGYGRLWRHATELAAVLVAVLLLAVIRALQLSRRISGPLSEMAGVAREVTRGEVGQRVRAETVDLETTALKDALNRMLDEVASHRARLEQMVAERTRHLEDALEELRTTRADLLQSTRLATVGETAGMAAHEILNPTTSTLSRLGRVARLMDGEARHNLDVLGQILDAWRQAFGADDAGAIARLGANLATPLTGVDGTPTTAGADDLRALGDVQRYLDECWSELRADVRFCTKETQRVAKIVEGMRALAGGSAVPEDLAVAELIDESVEIMRASIDGAGIRVATEVGNTRCRVDRHEAVQIFTNLLSNAVHAVSHGPASGAGLIRITTPPGPRGRVVVRVEDNGCGIPPAAAEKIFEFGFTTKPLGQGTGLGLGIARRLVRQHGGDLELESTAVGRGAVFRVTLSEPSLQPIAEAPRSELAA